MIIITNNPMVKEKINQACLLSFIDGSYGEVLVEVKQQIIEKHVVLLSHPLSGSIKPIESAIAVYEKFIKNKQRPNWSLAVLKDFAFVDFYIAQSTLDRMEVLR